MASHNDKFKKEIEEFIKKYPEPVQCNEEFVNAVELIKEGLSKLELTFSYLPADSPMLTIMNCASNIMTYIQKADILKPLTKTAFVIYMKLSYIILRLKNVYMPELLDGEVEIKQFEFMFDFKREQHLCDTYILKLENFKSCSNVEEIQMINEVFTLFLLEYLNFLSRIDQSPIKKNIKLLKNVGDSKLLLENMHTFLHVIPKPMRIPILKKMTYFCIENNFHLNNCIFIKSSDYDCKFETGFMSYYILLHIVKNHLDSKTIIQTSSIFNLFSKEETITLIDSTTRSSEFDKLCTAAVEMFSFKLYKKMKSVSSQKIKDCIDILQVLFKKLSDEKFENCPFPIVLLSMLYEFVMATDLDKPTIKSLINLVIGYLEIDYVPANFKAVTYSFLIYQKLKSDYDLEIKSRHLCKMLSRRFRPLIQHKITQENLEELINGEGDSEDKSVVLSYFLYDIYELDTNTSKIFNSFICTLNDYVLHASQNKSSNVQLIFPYSLSLHFSLISNNEELMKKNLAILDNYLNILIKQNQVIYMEDKIVFLMTIIRHYQKVVHCLPDEFFIKCWESLLCPENAEIFIAKQLLHLCSHGNFTKFIEVLKNETMKAIETNEQTMTQKYFLFLHELWSYLLNMQLIKKKKKIRKDHVNHFCYIINRTFLFKSKNDQTNHGLVLLLKLICSLLKVSWVNKTTLMNCALRVITLVEKHSSIDECTLTEAAELLIVLYKCPNNSIKPFLGLYIITFSNLVKKCWTFIADLNTSEKYQHKQLLKPFHKLDKCSNLFEPNKQDFNIISRYIIADLIQLLTVNKHLPNGFMRYFYNILFNLMDVCSRDEMMQLITSVQGPSLLILSKAYEEYRSNVRFTGRL